MAKNLLIVESPAKAKTINKYLGKDFTVLASYGHVRDLVPKEGAVDPEHGFAMSTGQFLAEGDYDPATRTYTYRGSMPDPMQPGATTPVRETLRVVDRDHHVMEYFESHDGQERKSMQIEYTRSK